MLDNLRLWSCGQNPPSTFPPRFPQKCVNQLQDLSFPLETPRPVAAKQSIFIAICTMFTTETLIATFMSVSVVGPSPPCIILEISDTVYYSTTTQPKWWATGQAISWLLVGTHVSNGATSSCLPRKQKKWGATSTTSDGLAIGHVFGSLSKATDACVCAVKLLKSLQ